MPTENVLQHSIYVGFLKLGFWAFRVAQPVSAGITGSVTVCLILIEESDDFGGEGDYQTHF